MNGIDISRSLSSYFLNSNLRCNGFLPNQELDLTMIPFLPFFLIHVWYFPNSNQLIGLDKKIKKPSYLIQLLCLIFFFLSIKISLEDTFYDFIYFKF